MARKQRTDTSASPEGLALATATAELKYRQTSSEFDLTSKDEESRRLRVKLLLLQNDVDVANQRYDDECHHREALLLDARTEADELQTQLASARTEAEQAQKSLKAHIKQCDNLKVSFAQERAEHAMSLTGNEKAELASMETVSADSNKVLSEKLALAREVATLKPEIEDLRSTVESQKGLLSEKLSLQRRLSTVQAELDSEKQNVERAKVRQGNQQGRDADYESEIDALRSELEQTRKQHEEDKKASRKEYLKDIAEFRKELELVEEERERLERAAASVDKEQPDANALDDLREELTKERKERQKLEKQLSKSNNGFEAQTAVLEDKLNQFRTKLKSTKEKLRETESELEEARSSLSSKLAAEVSRQSRNPRKRSVVQIDPDAAIGTPGDGMAAKRSKRASSVVGEKSTFSITPFLNRTSNVSIAQDSDEPIASIEVEEASPSTNRDQQSSPATKKPLAVAPVGKLNVSVAPTNVSSQPKPRKRTATGSSLEKVTEEEPGDEENIEPITNAQPTTAPSEKPKTMRQLKTSTLKPKPLSSFSSFREPSLAPENGQKKKRKLLGGPGPRTLFDEDEDDEAAPKPKATVTRRAFGALGAGKLGGLGGWGSKKKAPLQVAGDGFVFSPLKKDRKAAAAAS